MQTCLNRKSHKVSQLNTALEQYGMKMDFSERQNLKELCYALEGLECKNNSDDNLKVSTLKFIDYVKQFSKSFTEST